MSALYKQRFKTYVNAIYIYIYIYINIYIYIYIHVQYISIPIYCYQRTVFVPNSEDERFDVH